MPSECQCSHIYALTQLSQLTKTHEEGREEKGEVMPKDMQL